MVLMSMLTMIDVSIVHLFGISSIKMRSPQALQHCMQALATFALIFIFFLFLIEVVYVLSLATVHNMLEFNL